MREIVLQSSQEMYYFDVVLLYNGKQLTYKDTLQKLNINDGDVLLQKRRHVELFSEKYYYKKGIYKEMESVLEKSGNGSKITEMGKTKRKEQMENMYVNYLFIL
jgi:hypothetical protein